MLDTIVFPQKYAYSHRIDSVSDDTSHLVEFIARYKPLFYIFGYEAATDAPEGPKHNHFQGIMWFPVLLPKSKLDGMRNWWRTRVPPKPHGSAKYQPISLTPSHSPESLAKYAKKENNFITNIDKEKIQMIGDWDFSLTTGQEKYQFINRRKLYAQTVAEQINKYHSDEIQQCHKYFNTRRYFYEKLFNFHKENNASLPTVRTLNTLMMKNGLYSFEDWMYDEIEKYNK